MRSANIYKIKYVIFVGTIGTDAFNAEIFSMVSS